MIVFQKIGQSADHKTSKTFQFGLLRPVERKDLVDCSFIADSVPPSGEALSKLDPYSHTDGLVGEDRGL